MTLQMRAIFNRKPISINTLRHLILDNSVTENDTIEINQVDFDELALEYTKTYKQQLPKPFILLKVLIQEATRIKVPKGKVFVIENDTESLRVDPATIFDPMRVLYRCGFCGTLVGESGEELDDERFNQDRDYANRFKGQVVFKHREGKCCRDQQYTFQNSEADFRKKTNVVDDYDRLKLKKLMDLTDGELASIGVRLSKGVSAQFEVIYYCVNKANRKIYFTKNKDSFSERGFMLKEQKKIHTVDELIESAQNWQNR